MDEHPRSDVGPVSRRYQQFLQEQVMIRSICRVWLVVASFSCSYSAVGQETAPYSGDRLPDGWRKEVQLSSDGDVCIAWVEKGWLQVRRQSASGELEWQIVLAKATEP